ncbi:hypothetical protein KSP40_PGU013256 [Platanthera guangdongensis]|uniref:Uncharacterized protein n=1 Tax=Platanthera guangdongensis TaxID=2320717 RepID=A0ABR2MMT3_9ASPA
MNNLDLSDQSSDGVVNYSSSSYGGFLFRSPNSPPPSPSPYPSPSTASLSQLFLGERSELHGSRAAAYYSSPFGCFQLRQPPLLPFPRSATLPSPSIRSRRKNPKRKGKMFVGAMKEASPPTTKGKDEVKPVAAAMEVNVGGKVESGSWPMKTKPIEKEESRSSEAKVVEKRDEMESVYSQSPPPSSLPFPKFSMTRPKSNVGVAGSLAGTLA